MKRLSSRRGATWVIVVATLLAATSVGPHRALDDFVLSLIARGQGAALGLARHRLDLFTFTTGAPEDNRRLMDVGLMLPWWTDPSLHISFFRPLASLTHVLDEALWPSHPALMHLQSLAWFAAMLAAAALAFFRLEAGPLAGLSFALYALDDAHGSALSWLANRNALIATCFGCLCLVWHHAWRTRRQARFAVLAVASLILGLLAGELAIGAVAYLTAYAAYREDGPLVKRALSLAPHAAVILVWRVLWSRAGFGAHGSGAYIDPLRHTGDFLAVTPARVLLLLQAQFSGPPADMGFLGPPPHLPALVGLALVTATLVAILLVPILRRDRLSRFWALGMLLAVLPLSATFPSDRLLLFVGLGGSALVARVIETWVLPWIRGELRGFRPLLGSLFAVLHLAAAPVLLAGRSAQMEIFGVAADRAVDSVAAAGALRDKTVVIIAAPTLIFANYMPAERRVTGGEWARYQYVLSSASSKIAVERTGERAITLRPEHGFLYTPLERHYRGSAPFQAGDVVELTAMKATIVAMADERPRAVRFEFTGPLESYVFVTWKDGRYVPFELPPSGSAVELPEEDFGKILGATALSLLTGS